MIAAVLALSSYQVDEHSRGKLDEFFVGLKSENKHQLYAALAILRVTVYVVVLISCAPLASRVVIGTLTVVQVVFCIYSAILRPMIEVKANLIVIMNEAFFIFLLGSLAYYNQESDWSSLAVAVYVWTLGINTIITFVLIAGTVNADGFIVDEIRKLISWAVSK